MSEQHWLTDDDLEFLLDLLEGMASERKLRLFAVACCRSIWHLIADESCRTAVELAEEFADGRTTAEVLRDAWDAAEAALRLASEGASEVDEQGRHCIVSKEKALACDFPALAAAVTKEVFNEVYARDATDAATCVVAHSAIPPEEWGTAAGDEAAERAVGSEVARQLHFLRDIFGNPFRPTSLDRPGLTPTVTKMAQVIYNERKFEDLPILVDALEDAGCADEQLLSHLRGSGPHARGCWALDLLLGRD